MNTILGYIQETEQSCLHIIEHRKEITKPFVDLVMNQIVDELTFLGSGTSCHAAMVAKPFIEDICDIKVVTGFPTIFIDQTKKINKQGIVIGISQSGTSSSTKRALVYAKEFGVSTMLFTSNLNSFIEADARINIDCGDEKAVAKTKGYQASIVTLWLCALEWALASHKIEQIDYDQYLERLTLTVKNTPKLIEQSTKWYFQNKPKLSLASNFMVVGCESQYGNVLEAALKLVETVRIPVAGYELEEFMHGIYNAIHEHTFLIYIGHQSDYLDRLLKLKDYIANKTNFQFLITKRNEDNESVRDCVLDFIDDKYFCGLEYIVPFQIICHYLPMMKGIDPFISGDPNFHKTLSSKIVG